MYGKKGFVCLFGFGNPVVPAWEVGLPTSSQYQDGMLKQLQIPVSRACCAGSTRPLLGSSAGVGHLCWQLDRLKFGQSCLSTDSWEAAGSHRIPNMPS